MFNKMLATCFENIEKVNGRTKHFTFLANKSRIINVGWNDYDVNHPFIHKLNYGEKRMHSEVAALLPYRHDLSQVKGWDLINFRVNINGEIGMSKPCSHCENFIKLLGLKNIYYTDPTGNLVKIIY